MNDPETTPPPANQDSPGESPGEAAEPPESAPQQAADPQPELAPRPEEDSESVKDATPESDSPPEAPEPAEPQSMPQPEPTPPMHQQGPPPQLPAPQNYPPQHPESQIYLPQQQRPLTEPVLVGPSSHAPNLHNPRWRVIETGMPQWVLFAAVGAALFGGWTAFHAAGVGIGLSLTGIGLLAVAAAAGGSDGLGARLPGLIMVAALWSVAAIRDADWVVVFCTLAAIALTPLALAPQRRFTGTLLLMGGGFLEGLSGAFRWLGSARRASSGADTARNVRVAGITAGLLIVFGGLFAAADANFANLVARLLPDLDPWVLIGRTLLAGILFLVVLIWAYTALGRPRFDALSPGQVREVSRVEIAVPLGALNLLFAAFLAVQARVLYGGEDYLMNTADLTRADYARGGFWQLCFVAVLALGVIAVAAWLAPKRERSDRLVLRVLLGGLCLMSLAVLGSAAFRMAMYFEEFGMTRLRLWVYTVEVWLAVLFVLVLACCWSLRATWLPRAVLATGALTLLGLALVNPDALIARYNIDRYESTGNLDLDYLETLSGDAVPEIMELPEEHRECALNWYEPGWPERPPLAWNWGYERGRELAAEYKTELDDDLTLDCPGFLGTDYLEQERDGYGAAPDPYGTGPSVEEPSADPEPPDDADFFASATCEGLDLTAAEELFGTAANGDSGVEPDPAYQGGTPLLEDPAPHAPYGSLQCGYHGPGSRYLLAEAFAFNTAEDAVGWFTEARDTTADWSAYTSENVDLGFTSPEFGYMVVIDRLVFEVMILEADDQNEQTFVAADLAESQLLSAYEEVA